MPAKKQAWKRGDRVRPVKARQLFECMCCSNPATKRVGFTGTELCGVHLNALKRMMGWPNDPFATHRIGTMNRSEIRAAFGFLMLDTQPKPLISPIPTRKRAKKR